MKDQTLKQIPSIRFDLEDERIHRINRYWEMHDNFQIDTDIASMLLGKSPLTLKSWRSQKLGPKYTIGRPVTYGIGDLKQYLKDQKSRGGYSAKGEARVC